MRTTSVWSTADRCYPSSDHFVGGCQQCRGEVKPKRFGGLSIEHQVEFGHLIIRNVTRFCAFKYLSRHNRKATHHVYKINAVAEQATNLDEEAREIDRGQTVSGREIGDQLTMRHVV